jgi:hypothetical protein
MDDGVIGAVLSTLGQIAKDFGNRLRAGFSLERLQDMMGQIRAQHRFDVFL